MSHHLAHGSRAVLLPWSGAAVLVVAVVVAHRTTTTVALDALVASGALVVVMGAASAYLELRARAAAPGRSAIRAASTGVSRRGERSP